MKILKNCVPGNFFVGQGCGESDHGIHAGSFDDAMMKCGIEDYNLLIYSSILPKDANRVDAPKVYHHGEVLYTILASSSTKNTEDKQRLTAGIAVARMKDENGNNLGGLVAEYNGNAEPHEAKDILTKHIMEMFEKRKALREKY
jgi:arginine decarboxylase